MDLPRLIPPQKADDNSSASKTLRKWSHETCEVLTWPLTRGLTFIRPLSSVLGRVDEEMAIGVFYHPLLPWLRLGFSPAASIDFDLFVLRVFCSSPSPPST